MSDGPDMPGVPSDEPQDSPVSHARSTRTASVKFRDASAAGAERASQFDAANKSLMDALRFSYTLLGVAMAVLGVLYFASGFQTINESERGVKLRLGSVADPKMMPGPHWALPFPFGEIVRVSAGVEVLNLSEEFWPALSEQMKQQDPSQYPVSQNLAPERDGFLITADSAITHARWTVRYSKGEEPRDFAQNVFPMEEAEIVRAAVSRGIIQAVATVEIEAFLQAGDNSLFVMDARRAAQDVLDQIQSGIQIDDLTMTQKTPPMAVRAAFEQVQSAESSSNQIRQEANARRSDILNASAGAAASAILARIALYEAALELNDDAEAERVLGEINLLFDGEPTVIDGEERTLLVSGEVAKIMNEAREYRSNTVGMRRAEAIEFAAKNRLYETNPLVLVHTEWARGMETFYARPEVYMTFVPESTLQLELRLNKDPEYAQALEKHRKEQANLEAARERERARTQDQFKIDTGRQLMNTGG
jgi:modulator of FtsH protease HflK